MEGGIRSFLVLMAFELGETVVPALAAIGLGALLAPFRSPVPPLAPAVVFCDCPVVGWWLGAGVGIGFLIGAASVCACSVLLSRGARHERAEEAFFDAVEVLDPPVAAYRRQWRP